MMGSRGDEMLHSFILHNVLHVRHPSDLRNKVDAHGNSLLDIPADSEGRKMITALTPAQPFAMNRLVSQQLTSQLLTSEGFSVCLSESVICKSTSVGLQCAVVVLDSTYSKFAWQLQQAVYAHSRKRECNIAELQTGLRVS